jgi:hypothetical protein
MKRLTFLRKFGLRRFGVKRVRIASLLQAMLSVVALNAGIVSVSQAQTSVVSSGQSVSGQY